MRTEHRLRSPIDMDEAISLLERARDTKGADFVYWAVDGQCHYVPISPDMDIYDARKLDAMERVDDPRLTTGCLIGVTLDLAGETRHHEPRFYHGNVDSLWRGIDGLFADYDVVRVLSAAQAAQDNGATWGEAVEAAKLKLAQIRHQETIV